MNSIMLSEWCRWGGWSRMVRRSVDPGSMVQRLGNDHETLDARWTTRVTTRITQRLQSIVVALAGRVFPSRRRSSCYVLSGGKVRDCRAFGTVGAGRERSTKGEGGRGRIGFRGEVVAATATVAAAFGVFGVVPAGAASEGNLEGTWMSTSV